jgi:hypothetical protein
MRPTTAWSHALCEDFRVTQCATWAVVLALFAAGCSGSSESRSTGEEPPGSSAAAPGTVTRGDATTDLARTPVSAADYAMYAAIMGGASAMVAALSPADREALAFARKVDAGQATPTPATEQLLAQARALQRKDIELARIQGIEERYLQVKARIEAVIGPDAKPPAPDDAVAKENLRFLEAHRDNIERLQRIVRDPLSREASQTR